MLLSVIPEAVASCQVRSHDNRSVDIREDALICLCTVHCGDHCLVGYVHDERQRIHDDQRIPDSLLLRFPGPRLQPFQLIVAQLDIAVGQSAHGMLGKLQAADTVLRLLL